VKVLLFRARRNLEGVLRQNGFRSAKGRVFPRRHAERNSAEQSGAGRPVLREFPKKEAKP